MVEQTKISIICNDDSVTIMSFVTNDYRGINREATPENIEAEIKRAKIPMKSWRYITDNDIPKDRTFRNAWKDENNKIDIDMIKARDIHRNNLRLHRNKLLENLDVEYMKADESGDLIKKNQIINKKQQLRDITQHPAIELAKNPDELKAIWFDILD